MTRFQRLISVVLVYIAFSDIAYAYLDPVSITFILQGIAGAVAAVLAGVRSIRSRIVDFFKSLFGKNG